VGKHFYNAAVWVSESCFVLLSSFETEHGLATQFQNDWQPMFVISTARSAGKVDLALSLFGESSGLTAAFTFLLSLDYQNAFLCEISSRKERCYLPVDAVLFDNWLQSVVTSHFCFQFLNFTARDFRLNVVASGC